MSKSFEDFAKPFIDEVNNMSEDSGMDSLVKTIQTASVNNILRILKAYHEEFIQNN